MYKKEKKEIIRDREKFPTSEFIINVIYHNSEDNVMFYVTSEPEPVPNEEGWFYYDVVKLEN